jgi:hypothetical protein
MTTDPRVGRSTISFRAMPLPAALAAASYITGLLGMDIDRPEK